MTCLKTVLRTPIHCQNILRLHVEDFMKTLLTILILAVHDFPDYLLTATEIHSVNTSFVFRTDPSRPVL